MTTRPRRWLFLPLLSLALLPAACAPQTQTQQPPPPPRYAAGGRECCDELARLRADLRAMAAEEDRPRPPRGRDDEWSRREAAGYEEDWGEAAPPRRRPADYETAARPQRPRRAADEARASGALMSRQSVTATAAADMADADAISPEPDADAGSPMSQWRDPQLDSLLASERETEEAEQESRAEKMREAATQPAPAKYRKSWDVRIERQLAAPATRPSRPGGAARPATGPVGLLPNGGDSHAGRVEVRRDVGATPIMRAMLQSSPEKVIVLRRDFVEQYKNRVTITTPARIVHAGKVHKQADDGDQHIAVLADEVNLALCAEIMNARDEDDVVAAMEDADINDDIVNLSGAWRLWCEHPGNKPHVQDAPIPKYKHSNPDHVFEIHPVHRAVTATETFDLHDTLRPITGYTNLKQPDTFTKVYEKLPCRLEADDETVTIVTKGVGYNYVKFILQIEDEEQFETIDGRFVRCAVLDLNGKKLVSNRRLAFIRGTPPEEKIADMSKGQRLTVFGMPRIDLALVSYRIRNANERPEVLNWRLPYEIVVCGVYANN